MWNILSDRSPEWTSVRKKHLLSQPCCMACGSCKKIQVHHIEPFHVNPSRELDLTNLITLCPNCHFIFGHLMDYSSWNVDVINDCSVYLNKVKNRPYSLKVQNHASIFTIFSSILDRFCSLFWNHRP